MCSFQSIVYGNMQGILKKYEAQCAMWGCAKQHVRQCARNWRKKCAACKAVRQCARIGIGLWENVNRVARCSLPGQKSDTASMQPSGDCRQKSRLNKKIVACSPCAACHYLLPASSNQNRKRAVNFSSCWSILDHPIWMPYLTFVNFGTPLQLGL